MNFRPTIIKTLLAITIGLISAFYFRDNCFDCVSVVRNNELIVGFLPAFLWVYGFVSLLQSNEIRSRFWHYLVVVPFVIIIPFFIGIFLQGYFGL